MNCKGFLNDVIENCLFETAMIIGDQQNPIKIIIKKSKDQHYFFTGVNHKTLSLEEVNDMLLLYADLNIPVLVKHHLPSGIQICNGYWRNGKDFSAMSFEQIHHIFSSGTNTGKYILFQEIAA